MSITLTNSLQKNLAKLSPSTNSSSDASSAIISLINSTRDSIISLVDVFEQNLDILYQQNEKCSELIAILEEAGGLTVRARHFVNSPQDAEKYRDKTKDIETLFKATLKKLDKAVADSAYKGINLANGDSLITKFDDKGSSVLSTQGIILTSQNLGIRDPNFENMMGVQNARIDVMNAMDMAVTLRNIISSDIATLNIRRDFAHEFLETAIQGQNAIRKCTAENEISNLIKLNTQNSLSAEPLADPAQQEVLSSFASSPNMEDI